LSVEDLRDDVTEMQPDKIRTLRRGFRKPGTPIFEDKRKHCQLRVSAFFELLILLVSFWFF